MNFNDLIHGMNEDTEIEDYLADFFSKKNFKQYEINPSANKYQVKAIKTMFESKKSLKDRIEDVFDIDPFCVEALFSYLMISEDVFVQLRFNSYFEQLNDYANFDEYQKISYIKILDFYVEFLLDIGNLTKAIIIDKLIVKLTNNFSPRTVSRLCFAYFNTENADDFYRLFCETQFNVSQYMLCMVTLLKNDEGQKAQEVLLDLFKNNEYGTYLDHVWDLDENVPKEKEFIAAVQHTFDDCRGVPTFFSWVNKTREKYGK